MTEVGKFNDKKKKWKTVLKVSFLSYLTKVRTLVWLMPCSKASERQGELCVTLEGTVKRADPYVAFVKPEVAEDEEDELMRLRRERKAQLQQESVWKKQGHGSLRELADEKEFVQTIAPHERALVLLDDGRSSAGEVCRKVLGRLASKHLEAQFCSLAKWRFIFNNLGSCQFSAKVQKV